VVYFREDLDNASVATVRNGTADAHVPAGFIVDRRPPTIRRRSSDQTRRVCSVRKERHPDETISPSVPELAGDASAWRRIGSSPTSPIRHDNAYSRDEKQTHLKEVHSYGEGVDQAEGEVVREVDKDRRQYAPAITSVCPRVQDRKGSTPGRTGRVSSFSSQTLQRLHSRSLNRPICKAQPPPNAAWGPNLV